MARVFAFGLAAFVLATLPMSGLAQTDGSVWLLQELDGRPFPAEAQLTLPKDGQITGRGPCNRFFATAVGEVSALVIGPVGATKMACPDLGLESAFFAALPEIVWAEVSGSDRLILGDDKGLRMVFRRQPD